MSEARRTILLLLALQWAASFLEAQQSPLPRAIDIRLASGTGLEQRGQEQLERILARWDVSRWLFTRTVQVRSRVIPHSHLILTLNTQYLGDDTAQVATLLHEELHWFLVQHQAATDSAIADLRRRYPLVPDQPPEGAQDQEGTYLHLLVCLLEYDAVGQLLSEETARRTLRGWPYYTWVYREVLDRPEPIRQILRTYHLNSPDARM